VTPLLEHDRAAVIQGDALTVLAGFGPKSVQASIFDPPYGEHTHKMLGREQRNDGHAKREALTFAHLTLDDVNRLAEQTVRITEGWAITFTDDRSVPWWGEAYERAGARWMRTGHWVKTNPMPQMTGDRPSVGTEPIVIAWCGTGRSKWAGGGRAAVWRGPRDTDGLHPNQKPRWLMQELCGLFVPAGGVVIDPFFGSGSTGEGALARDRFPGLSPMESGCPKCTKKHSETLARSPMPDNVSVIGIERDPTTAAGAAARIRKVLETIG
jgi:site-specific DNA-methyltransferase (adenine-specific)